MAKNIRTRFAPSPTGFMHVGGVRTALFAWLVARHGKGQFILRIEDTDKAREVRGSEAHIMESLRWLGLEWDEGPDKGGSYGPYRQSERLDIYKQWAQKLIDKGRAYADPYSAEVLETFRQKAKDGKRPFLFRDHRPDKPPKWDGSQPLRFKSEPKNYAWQDAVMGELSAGPEAIDDFIILKSDGYPTYNFAHIIDDHLMKVSHVIRSQEFLPSVPKFLDLYAALEIEPPTIVTLPYVMGPDGKKKLSKRDGAKDILDYQKDGFLPEALVNFLATLGWNDGTEQEIFSINDLVKKFDLSRVQKGGARFDEQRLEWINGNWLRQLPIDDLCQRAKGFWPSSAQNAAEDYKQKVLGLIQERLKYLSEIPQLTDFFFEDKPIDMQLIDGNKQLKDIDKTTLSQWLTSAREELASSDFASDVLQQKLNDLLKSTGQKPAVLFSLIRMATTWSPASPSLAETLAVLGKDKTLERLDKTIAALGG